MNLESDALKRFFAAVNRNDMQALARDFDPPVVRVEPEGLPAAGTCRGIPEVREHVRTGRSTWGGHRGPGAELTRTPRHRDERL
jgi:uncharacterized protein